MQRPRRWPSGTVLVTVLTFAVPSSAGAGARPIVDVHLGFLQKQTVTASSFPRNASFFQQIPMATTTGLPALPVTTAAAITTTGLPAIIPTTAAALPAIVPTTMGAPPMGTPVPGAVGAVTAAPAMPVVLGAPAPAPVAPPPPPSDDPAMRMPSVKATDMFPGLPPDAAEALMKAAEQNAAPAGGPEAQVIADWAERFGGFAVGATVKAMRDVVSKIAREKAEEVIAQVFHSKYPNLHVHGLLPPMPAPAPGPAMVALAPGVPASAPAR